MMPRQARGSVIRKKTAASFMPRMRAACSSWPSMASKAARAGLNTSGKATTEAAMTAPCQVKIRLMPKVSCSHPPSQPRRPMSTSR